MREYFVVMCDFGASGLEAIVDPKIDRAGVIQRIKSGEYEDVVFIHHIKAGIAFDVTDDLMQKAFEDDVVEDTPAAIREAYEADRRIDQRKEFV